MMLWLSSGGKLPSTGFIYSAEVKVIATLLSALFIGLIYLIL
jgi:hypothetical protein